LTVESDSQFTRTELYFSFSKELCDGATVYGDPQKGELLNKEQEVSLQT